MTITVKETKVHYRAVIAALPKAFRRQAEISYKGLEVGQAVVEINPGRGSYRPTIKLTFSYRLDSLDVKDRSWKIRLRDDKFCYDRIAGHIVSALTQYDALVIRRDKGKSIAEVRSKKLTQVFSEDQLLSRLNVEIRSDPVNDTEDGTLRVEFRCKANGNTVLRFNGERFDGTIKVFNLSVEQITAIMAVINLDQLNVLDLITLADDSILGPSIKRLTAEMDDA